MIAKPDRLSRAYGLKTHDDTRRLYAEWAETYDDEFVRATGYRLPEAVAAAYAARGGAGPVLDIGAGTGLVGERLAARGIGPVDGTDLSAEMLQAARGRGVYRDLIEADVTAGLDVPDAAYAGVVSAGTFTLGHLGPDALSECLRAVRPGGRLALSINAAHWAAEDFASTLASLPLEDLRRDEVPIYADDHGTDRAFIVTAVRHR